MRVLKSNSYIILGFNKFQQVFVWNPEHGGIQLECLSEKTDMFPVTSLTNMAHDLEHSNGDTQQVLAITQSPKLNAPCGFVDYLDYGLDDVLLVLCKDKISKSCGSRNKMLTCGSLLMDDASHEQQPFDKKCR